MPADTAPACRKAVNDAIKGSYVLATGDDNWLDSIAPDNPVALQLIWGHGTVLNSKAMSVLGISDLLRTLSRDGTSGNRDQEAYRCLF